MRLHRRSGDRHPDLGQQLPDEERGCPKSRAKETPSGRSFERHQVADHPDGIRRAIRREPDEADDDERIEREREDPERLELRAFRFARGSGDRHVPQRKSDDERDAEGQHEGWVARPVADREPHLDGSERCNDPAQHHQTLLQEACIIVASYAAHPRSFRPIH
ncbi:MAG: hypothetical protein E6G54_07050 [Actinobacteria bacterium]|nr:MAG: hypothetical protein E6G54_07050 [Actinomycetota bacterium]